MLLLVFFFRNLSKTNSPPDAKHRKKLEWPSVLIEKNALNSFDVNICTKSYLFVIDHICCLTMQEMKTTNKHIESIVSYEMLSVMKCSVI